MRFHRDLTKGQTEYGMREDWEKVTKVEIAGVAVRFVVEGNNIRLIGIPKKTYKNALSIEVETNSHSHSAQESP